jgi:archaellum biogenesis ATPase FlaH
MEKYENDEMIMVEADFEIIRKLTKKVNLLDKNLDNLINSNNKFIENMLIMDTLKYSCIRDNNNDDKKEIENNLEFVKNKLHNMKLEDLKNICKKNEIKKYSIYNKNSLIDYIINYKDINKLIF